MEKGEVRGRVLDVDKGFEVLGWMWGERAGWGIGQGLSGSVGEVFAAVGWSIGARNVRGKDLGYVGRVRVGCRVGVWGGFDMWQGVGGSSREEIQIRVGVGVRFQLGF